MIEFLNSPHVRLLTLILVIINIIIFVSVNIKNWKRKRKTIRNEIKINENGLYVQGFHKLHDIHLFLIENSNVFMEYVGSKEEISTEIAKRYLNLELYKDFYSPDVCLLNMVKHFPYYLIYVKI
jgi:hypothetical protein